MLKRHYMHNKFPYILRYIIPRPLLLKTFVEDRGYQIYKWLWWYYEVPVKNKF